MWKKLHSCLLVAVAAWALIGMPMQAMADDATLQCSGGGSGYSGLLLDTTGTGNVCSFVGIQHIFSSVMCQFVHTLNAVLGMVYCAMQYTLTPVMGALFTLYIAVFGAQILMGSVQITAKEIIVRLVKIGIVWEFVTNANWAIGYGFAFFTDLANEGVYTVIKNVAGTGGCNVPTSAGSSYYVYCVLDNMVYQSVVGPFTHANSMVIVFFVAMASAMPQLYFLALAWLWVNFSTMVRAIISFMLGLTAIAFLISLSPIFLSFMLFKSTANFFENWLKYMISYSLQIVVVFGCVALWIGITLQLVGFFNNFSTLLYKYHVTEAKGTVSTQTYTAAICPYTYNGSYSTAGYPAPMQGPSISCDTAGPLAVGSGLDSDGFIIPTLKGASDPTQTVVTPENVSKHPDLVYYIIYNLAAMIIAAYAFSALLQEAPKIANALAGPEYVPILGSGFGFGKYGQFTSGAGRKAEEGEKHGIGGLLGPTNFQEGENSVSDGTAMEARTADSSAPSPSNATLPTASANKPFIPVRTGR